VQLCWDTDGKAAAGVMLKVSGSRKAGLAMSQSSKFVIRTYHRIPVRCLLYYMGVEFLGKGTVMNLSRNGFRVLGDHQVVPGMELVVRLSLPDKDETVEIQRVVVRWVRGLLFGAKVVTMSPEGEERIGTFLSSRLRTYCALP
jgi:hypothetical protein